MSPLPVQDIFKTLHDAGLSVSLIPNGCIGISPASRLTDELRILIRGHKAFLLDWLLAANDPEPPVNPNAWRELAQAYHDHHFKCKYCIAAGRGAMFGLRCGVGAALWRIYQSS